MENLKGNLRVVLCEQRENVEEKKFNLLTTQDSAKYFVDPRQYLELKYELYKEKLQIESYLTFLAELTATNSFVINFFGGLKPCTSSFAIISSQIFLID